MPERIAAPRPPEPPQPYRFPVIATVAPVVVSLSIFWITGSAFALIFAAIGPVTAVAGLADARLGSRRTRRRELARFAADLEVTAQRIATAHERERADLGELAPAPRRLVAPEPDPRRWAADPATAVPVSLGIGTVPSEVALDRSPGDELDELAQRAQQLTDAPVVVDARLGIGVVGPHPVAAAVARGIVVSVARALSPADFWCGRTDRDGWLTSLPHPVGPAPTVGDAVAFGRRGERAAVAVIAVAQTESGLPGACRVVLRVGAAGAAIVRHPDRSALQAVRVEPLGRVSAAAWARRVADDATRDGLVADGRALPDQLPLNDLPLAPDVGLAAIPGVDAAGPLTVDLVADGPHAIVGGTTGSGKSEFLVSWVLAMAAAHPPARFAVLLIDFKGGTAFARLAALPHTAGIVTDLDEENAARALASLRAELRYRERALADAGVTDVAGVPGLPRLVIVVDEFAAMLAERPELHEVFADLAARGRALGVHLVLCTQRPTGVVRDAVLANADLRISLRVNNRADSTAVVGTDAAAALPAGARGRGILAAAGDEPRPVQFALAGPDAIDAVLALHPGAERVRPPWLPPLPAALPPGEHPGAFGLLDVPERQRREPAVWASSDGHLLVLGAAGSGATTALAAVGGADPTWIPAEPAAAWDAIADLEAARDRLVLIDDADALLARLPADARVAIAERLVALLRDGGHRGLRFALAARRVTPELQPIAALAPARLVLRHASRHDVLLAGGSSDDFRAGLPAGGGSWQGHRVQVFAVDPRVPPSPGPRIVELDARPIAVVSSRAGAIAGRLAGRVVPLAQAPDPLVAAAGTVLLGDPDEWQGRWGAIAALRPYAQILLDGCSAAEFRAVTRSRELPPPISGHPDLCWRLEPDGSAVRVRLPLRDQASASASAT